MISLKIGGFIVAAFIAGAFLASPELRAYAANTVGSADIINNSILSADIKDGEVKAVDLGGNAVTTAKIAPGGVANSDIAANAVTGNKIADETIAYADVSRALIVVENRIDCNCGGTGWDPDGVKLLHQVSDNNAKAGSVIVVSLRGSPLVCTGSAFIGSFLVNCNKAVVNGAILNYAIFNHP